MTRPVIAAFFLVPSKQNYILYIEVCTMPTCLHISKLTRPPPLPRPGSSRQGTAVAAGKEGRQDAQARSRRGSDVLCVHVLPAGDRGAGDGLHRPLHELALLQVGGIDLLKVAVVVVVAAVVVVVLG